MDEITEMRVHPRGTATALDLEAVAVAFGFHSVKHLNDVAAGRAPSALEDNMSRLHPPRYAA